MSNKRPNSWTDRAQIFCGTSGDHREGLWTIKISNICLHQNSIFIKFLKILIIREIFCENPRIIFVLFYDVHKENMFSTNLEDGREAPSKASLSIKVLHYTASKWNKYIKLRNRKNIISPSKTCSITELCKNNPALILKKTLGSNRCDVDRKW